jgi:hypothetical protein
MFSLDRRYLTGLMAAAVTLLPSRTEAQTMARSPEELIPTAAIVLVTDETRQGTSEEDVSLESSRPLTRPGSLGRTTRARCWFEHAADQPIPRPRRSPAFADSAMRARQQPGPKKQSWIGRHPALFGALVGFGGGFLIGYLPGDDAVFDDFTAGFNGMVMGGIGAGTGAALGAIIGAARK